MCMVDDCEPWEFSSEVTRKARKVHKCDECRRTIDPGETYRNGSGMTDGWFTSWKRCAHCNEATRWLEVACSGYLISEVEEDLYHHIRGQEEGELSSRPLVRLVRWMVADWRTRDGQLRDVEAVRGVADQAIAAYRVQYDKAVAA